MRLVKGASASASEPEVHLAVAVADRERAAATRADHQFGVAGEENGEREGALQPLRASLQRLLRRHAVSDIAADQVNDHLGVGLRREPAALGRQFRRSAWKFSMMPLCTRTTRSSACGMRVDLRRAPCVAQRVWPMPI